jgi:mono/diheme cytochrome c family protein
MKRMSCHLFFGAILVVVCGCAHAQPSPPATHALVQVVPPPAPPVAAQPVVVPPPATLQPPPATPMAPPPQPALENFIAFDAEQKAVSVTNGTIAAQFTFNLTNVSSADVTINFVQTSCGCTVAKLPSNPWKMAPNEHGEISATMQLAGTPPGGTKIKTLTVNTDKGNKALYVKATVLPDAAPMTEMDRTNAQKIALADRQAVFKGDCARCHVTPAKDAAGQDKMGKDLYTAVCGVCHEAEHRASFVADLHHLPEPTNAEFWKNWVAHGKPGTLMPAFAKTEGGILSDAQIASLTQYLTETIPSHPATIAPPSALNAHAQ